MYKGPFISQHGTLGTWNTGAYDAYVTGPSGWGNGIALWRPSAQEWQLHQITDYITTNVNGARFNNAPGQVLPRYNIPIHSFMHFDENDQIVIDHLTFNYGLVRADPVSGVTVSPGAGANAADGRWTLLAMLEIDNQYGVQGQVNSEFLIDRHQQWTTGLKTNPYLTNIPPSPQYVKVGLPLKFLSWSDKMAFDIHAAIYAFNDAIGASLDIAITYNGDPNVPVGVIAYGAAPCVTASAPNPIFCDGKAENWPDGPAELQVWFKANAGTSHIGVAVNSEFNCSIWF